MAQILNTPTIAQMAAQQIGSPITNALQSLANMQVENLQKQKQRSEIVSGLSSLIPREQAEAISYLPPYLQFSLLSRYGRRGSFGNKKLDANAAQEILRAAGGDKNLARKLAKELGFSF